MWVSTEAISCPFCFSACSIGSHHPIPRFRNISQDYLFKGGIMQCLSGLFIIIQIILEDYRVFSLFVSVDFSQGRKHFYLQRMKVKIFAGVSMLFSVYLGEKKAIYSVNSIVLHLDVSSLKHFSRLVVIKSICLPVHVQ